MAPAVTIRHYPPASPHGEGLDRNSFSAMKVKNIMARFQLIRRSSGMFNVHDAFTGKRESLHTRKRADAIRLVHARNEAVAAGMVSLQMARAYATAADPAMATRTWNDVMTSLLVGKDGPNLDRYERAWRDTALVPLLKLVLIETRPEHLHRALVNGTVATNVYLRRLHNFAMDMSWLPWPVIPKRQWPKVVHKERRAITEEEHIRILAREKNTERRTFYEMLWHLGGSQGDIACLKAADVDWNSRTVSYVRKKTGEQCQMHFGDKLAALLRTLPPTGPLFRYLSTVRSADRATEFRQRCVGLGIHGVSLHSYRYAWAERALSSGYPERFAQGALGHSSKAVHRAYAKHAHVSLPSLEEFEAKHSLAKIVKPDFAHPAPDTGDGTMACS